MTVQVNWPDLRAAAVEAAELAYSPYSGLQVGVAALVDDGRVVIGCNVENASYGVGLCAECTMAGQLRLTGGGRLVAVACRSGDAELLMPCGRCRQILYELGGPECLRSEEHTSELQSRENLVCRLLLEKKNTTR